MEDASPETRRYAEEMRYPPAKVRKKAAPEPEAAKRVPKPVRQRNYTGWFVAILVVLVLILYTANRIAMSIDSMRVY